MATTTKFGITQLVAEAAGNEVRMNTSIATLDAVTQMIWLDRALNTPPGSPAETDGYLIGAAPTGAWAAQANKITFYIGGQWIYIAAKTGMIAYVVDEACFYVYNGSAWVTLSSILAEKLAIADLSDISGVTGTGTTAVLSADPTLTGTTSVSNLTMSSAGLVFSSFSVFNATNPSAQGNGPITNLFNIVTAVTTGDCVTLPSASAGKVVFIRHAHTSNTLDIYPASGDSINALAVNTKYSLIATRGLIAFAIDSTVWWVFVFGAAG